MAAQVTSLIWSKTRREIAATFGYAQPEHPYRIAVFSWPKCEQVVAIPWNVGPEAGIGGRPAGADGGRALWAIPYPGGPNETSATEGRNSREDDAARPEGEGRTWWSRTAEEGCIIVASSDESVKFHEVWSGRKKSTVGGWGLLGGSDILEGLEGIEREGGQIIR